MARARKINKSGIPSRISRRRNPVLARGDKNARSAPPGTYRANEAWKWVSVSRDILRLRQIHKFLYYTWQVALVRITRPRCQLTCASVRIVKYLPSLYHDAILYPPSSENCSWRYIKLIYIKLEAFSDRIVAWMVAQLIRHYEGLERIRDTIYMYNM